MTRGPDATGTAATDLVYAAVVTVAAVLAIAGAQFSAAVVVCILIALIPWVLLAFRHRLPLLLFAALAVVPVVPVVAWTGIGSALFLTTATASWVASRTPRWSLVAPVAAVVIALPFLPFALGMEWDRGAVFFAFGNAFGVLIGVLLRRSNELANRLRIADAELAAAAAREERHRIARDVHDLVAHSLTIVVLHVGGARRVLRTDPDAAETALVDAEHVCRESLDGIRGVVGLLRDDAEPHALSLDFDQLVSTYRTAGLAIGLHKEGAPESLPLGARVTLYRVVQEALANAARHARAGTSIDVTLLIDDAGTVARVTNTDRGTSSARALPDSDEPRSGGFGLVGLREQVAAVGGELRTSRRSTAWVLECRLPPLPRDDPGAGSSLPAEGDS